MAEPNQIPQRIWTSKGWLTWDPDKGYFSLESRSGTQEAIENLTGKPMIPSWSQLSPTEQSLRKIQGEKPPVEEPIGYKPDHWMSPQSEWTDNGMVTRPPIWPKSPKPTEDVGPQLPQEGVTTGPNLPAQLSALREKWLPTQGGARDASKATEMLGAMPTVQSTGREPWEMAAEQQQYEGNRRKAMYWGALSSVPGTGTAQAEDLMSPQERMYIEDKIGLKLPQGFKRSQFQQTFGRGTAMGMTPYQEMSLGLQERRLGLGERESQRRGSQFQQSMDIRKTQQARLPTQADEEAIGMQRTVANIQDIAGKFDRYSEEIGPIKGTWNEVLNKVGMGNRTPTELIGALVELTGTYVKAMAQSRFSDTDLATFSRGLPKMVANPEQFKAALDYVRSRIKMAATAAKSVYGSQKYNTMPFDTVLRMLGEDPDSVGSQEGSAPQASQMPSAPQQATGGLNVTVRAQAPDGSIMTTTVSRDDLEAAKKSILENKYKLLDVKE